jgi:serine/threonine protein kinase
MVLIGEGGTAKVYEATNWKTRSKSIVKIISSKISQTPRKVDTIKRGLAASMAACRIPKSYNIEVACYESMFQTPKGELGIVMNFIDGVSFETIIDRNIKTHGVLPIDVSVYMCKELFRTVAVLHRFNIAHRDVNCRNVLWDLTKRRIALIDFDTSCLDVECQIYCSPRYKCTPETATFQLTGKLPLIDGQPASSIQMAKMSDVWMTSLACFELITNSPSNVTITGDDKTEHRRIDIIGCISAMKGDMTYSYAGKDWMEKQLVDILNQGLLLDVNKRLSAEEILKQLDVLVDKLP